MAFPADGDLRALLDWQPRGGVLSVYLHVDHADRAGGWRIALSDALRESVRAAGEPAELRATAERVLDRFGDGDRPPEARGHVGFVQISAEPGEERWFSSSAYPRRAAIAIANRRPHLQPLIEIVDDNRRRGVIAVAGDRARMLEWEQAKLTEISEREILTTGDWRERKAPRNVDVPGGQAPSSSGRDQHEQRLEDHRRRFVGEVAEEAAATAAQRDWQEVLCFGEAKYLSELERKFGPERISHAEEKNLLSIPEHELSERLAALTERLNRRRELDLIDRAEGAALAGERGSLGLAETAQALAEGRVEHLLIAASELRPEASDEIRELLGGDSEEPCPTGELLIERALETGASITPVEDEAAERLRDRDGAAAILRY